MKTFCDAGIVCEVRQQLQGTSKPKRTNVCTHAYHDRCEKDDLGPVGVCFAKKSVIISLRQMRT